MSKELILYLAITGVCAYFLGGINGAIIASFNFFKKDIRKFGSGNAGLTNFARTFGTNGVAIVILVDILKTVAAVLIGYWLIGHVAKPGYPMIGMMFAGFCAMLGHVYPVYYRFKGGKAALCAGTVAFMADWRVGLVCFTVFIVIVVFTKYVSLASISSCLLLPITIWSFGYSGLEGLLGFLCALLLVIAHRENIRKLLNGTESKLNIGGGGKRG